MDSGKISTRYAKAIYRFAVSCGEESRLAGEMKVLTSQFEKLPELKKALENPTVSNEEKHILLLTASGGDVSDTCRRALQLVVGNGRAGYMPSVALMYDKVYRREKRILRVDLTTVEPASREIEQSLIGLITDRAIEKVDFDARSDGGIIGGFVLQIEDRRLDASVRSQLNQIRLKLLGKGV
ncbi:MAG: ATP synthase F1 subunit delta [Dysgonamonadaceae bacterium]|jgi:F-type H+-transporting ATPase subunit delta|nr:ATP synthase F1 subunit delta [Dysgonamonadaceae bacterium]